MRKAILWPLALVVLIGCSAEAPEGGADKAATPPGSVGSTGPGGLLANRLPIVRLATIQPSPVLPGEPLRVRVEADDPDGDAVIFRHQWLANGERIEGQTQPTLDLRLVKRNDLVAVEVIPLDGKAEGPPYRTEAVVIPNSPPEVTRITLKPGEVRVGDRISAKVEGTDVDQDFIRYQFRWTRNGAIVLESEEEEGALDTAGFARGDVLLVEVIPSDSTSRGRVFRSPSLTILNSHPKITSIPPATIEGGRYTYDVKAADPEGDPLTYALETAPPGMTIDQGTGRIEWKIPAETRGTHRVRVSVRDNRDGYAFQEFDLGLPPS